MDRKTLAEDSNQSVWLEKLFELQEEHSEVKLDQEHNNGAFMKDNKDSTTSYIGVGIGVGIAIGAALGVAMDNIGLWLPVGLAIGVAIGATLNASKNKKS